jgi:hypothetical protein
LLWPLAVKKLKCLLLHQLLLLLQWLTPLKTQHLLLLALPLRLLPVPHLPLPALLLLPLAL